MKQVNSINNFIIELNERYSFKDPIYINCFGNPVKSIFGDFPFLNKKLFEKRERVILGAKAEFTVDDFAKKIKPLKQKYDLILGEFPFNMRPHTEIDNVTMFLDHACIYQSLLLLNESGIGIFAMSPGLFFQRSSLRFINFLNKNNFFVNAVFQLPKESPYFEGALTSIIPLICIVSRKNEESVFISEINRNNINEIINNYTNRIDSKNIELGTYVDRVSFKGIDNFKAQKEIEILLKNYKNCKNYSLKELALDDKNSFKTVSQGSDFKDDDNCIYIPKIGNSDVVCEIDEIKIKHQNIFQIKLNKDMISNVYAASFLSSNLGKHIRDSISLGVFIQKISLKDIKNMEFPVPILAEQKNIINTVNSIKALIKKLNSFNNEISLNPNSITKVAFEIKQMLNQVDDLSESDKIFNLMRKGESKILEFKSSFRQNLKSNKFDIEMQYVIMKTINAMLNTLGGTLLIGVSEDEAGDGKVIGIEHDKYKNNDKYNLAIKQFIENYMSKTVASKINISFIEIDEKQVCVIEVPIIKKTWMRYKEEYINGKRVIGKGKLVEKLFIRTGPSSKELLPSEVDQHFDQ